MALLRVTPIAEADMDQLLDQLAIDAGKTVAKSYRDDLLAAFDHLTGFPRTGAPRPKFGREVRIWTVDPYVIYHRYMSRDDVVLIMRVLHGKRKVTKRTLSAP